MFSDGRAPPQLPAGNDNDRDQAGPQLVPDQTHSYREVRLGL